jgi:DNA-binding IclR family transcriptional regulator
LVTRIRCRSSASGAWRYNSSSKSASLGGCTTETGCGQSHVRFRGYRTTVARALEQIALTRRRGYCLHHTGLVPGSKAISTTIRALDGQPAAAITIAAVRGRLGPRREDEIVEILKLASSAIDGRCTGQHGLPP